MCLQGSEYPCNYEECGRYQTPFKSEQGLSQHIAEEHARNKGEYPCPFLDCGRHEKPFNTEQYRKRHCFRIHTEGVTFFCPEADCPRKEESFQTAHDLTKHKPNFTVRKRYSNAMNSSIPSKTIIVTMSRCTQMGGLFLVLTPIVRETRCPLKHICWRGTNLDFTATVGF
jgi:hypothetical protein